MNTLPLPETEASKPRVYHLHEYKLVSIRETTERDNPIADTPESAAAYWRNHIRTSDQYRSDVESFWVLFVNTRRRVKGHFLCSTGTLDTIIIQAREVFRAAIVANAAAVILMHNHPSGDPSPSEADIKVTRDLMRAGQLLKVEVLDHLVMGERTPASPKDFASLRELGYFCN